jgi:phosphoserine phosphatase RsbU/P
LADVEKQRRHRLEATLLRTLWRAEAHRRLAESNILGVVFADLEGSLTGANDEFLRMVGYSRVELEAGELTLERLVPPDLRTDNVGQREELLKKGVLNPRESVYLAKDGQRVPVLVGVALMEGSDQKTIGFVLDLTEQKQAEDTAKRYASELGVKNAQMEEDLRMAREIQQAFLPQQYPSFPHDSVPATSAIHFVHRYFPAGPVGGDFFDVLALSDTSALVIICDVMGHGVRAALVTAMVRTLVEQLKVVGDAGRMLTELNRGLIATFRQTGSRMFVSACCLVADLRAGTLDFANAGHPSPILFRAEGRQASFLKSPNGVGPAMGLLDDSVYASARVPLASGDRVMLFTDGLYELEDEGPEPFSQEQLLEVAAEKQDLPIARLFDELLEEVYRRSASRRLLDDVCMVGMEVRTLLPRA